MRPEKRKTIKHKIPTLPFLIGWYFLKLDFLCCNNQEQKKLKCSKNALLYFLGGDLGKNACNDKPFTPPSLSGQRYQVRNPQLVSELFFFGFSYLIVTWMYNELWFVVDQNNSQDVSEPKKFDRHFSSCRTGPCHTCWLKSIHVSILWIMFAKNFFITLPCLTSVFTVAKIMTFIFRCLKANLKETVKWICLMLPAFILVQMCQYLLAMDSIVFLFED